PMWSRDRVYGEVVDGSGLGVDADEERAFPTKHWVFVNTDRMQLVRGPVDDNPPPRAALTDGTPLHVYDYEAELINGFEQIYRFLVRERGALLAPDSPFQRLSCAKVRFVHRHTTVYSALLDRLRQPDFLRDGLDRSLEIERLAFAAFNENACDGRSGWVDI